MRVTGAIRRVDDLGRVVLPKEIRRYLRIKDGTPMVISVRDNEIVLKKYYPVTCLQEVVSMLETQTEELSEELEGDILNDIKSHIQALQELTKGEKGGFLDAGTGSTDNGRP